MFAAVLIAVLCIEHQEVTRSGALDVSTADAPAHDSFESVLQRSAGITLGHSAQLTDLALSNSTSTAGETPTK